VGESRGNSPFHYAPWIRARLEGPLLLHNRDGEPTYWKFLARGGNRITGSVDIDVQRMVLVRFGWYCS